MHFGRRALILVMSFSELECAFLEQNFNFSKIFSNKIKCVHKSGLFRIRCCVSRYCVVFLIYLHESLENIRAQSIKRFNAKLPTDVLHVISAMLPKYLPILSLIRNAQKRILV